MDPQDIDDATTLRLGEYDSDVEPPSSPSDPTAAFRAASRSRSPLPVLRRSFRFGPDALAGLNAAANPPPGPPGSEGPPVGCCDGEPGLSVSVTCQVQLAGFVARTAH